MADYSGWFDQNEQKEKRRLFLHAERQLPIPLYQLLIGLIILLHGSEQGSDTVLWLALLLFMG